MAIKILDKTKLDQKTQRLLSREISSMEKLHHPNIIRLYEVVETLSRLHLVMEYAGGGELFGKISTEGKLSEPESKLIFSQIVSAVKHMVRGGALRLPGGFHSTCGEGTFCLPGPSTSPAAGMWGFDLLSQTHHREGRLCNSRQLTLLKVRTLAGTRVLASKATLGILVPSRLVAPPEVDRSLSETPDEHSSFT